MTRLTRAWLISILGLAPLSLRAQSGLIRLSVDATNAPRRLIHAQLTIPASPGPMTLLYPRWIPGEHGPTGPIADLVNLKLRSGGSAIAWKRDDIDLFAFHITVPAGANAVDADFDFISPPDAGGFSAGTSMTTELAVISWNQVLLYPQGSPADDLRYQAKLRLPKGWQYGTALPLEHESGTELEFQPVSLTTLVDSPVSAGAHYKTIDLGAADSAPHFMHIAADSDRAIADTPEWIAHYRKLVAEAGALFGSRHYRDYHFLLTLSDHVASFGLEHHESSDDRLEERTLLDNTARQLNADLLAHEYVHSWNGKFRRPAGLITRDYSQPMRGDLLWIYEGLTEYLGEVLAARSGMESEDRFRDWLGVIGASLDHESGRAWRPLSDTAISAQILFDAREDYSALRRSIDFYSEGALVWLEVDVTLRQLSHGAKSLDDFCRAFFGGAGGAPAVSAYTLDDVIAALNAVQPHDWAALFQKRVDTVEMRAPLAGIENAGWKLTYRPQRSDYWQQNEDDRKLIDLGLSVGMTVRGDGMVGDVAIGGPAQKAGIAPGGKITSVNGREFSATELRDAIQAATKVDDPIEIVVKNGEYFTTHQVIYHGGERYPHLDRETRKPDILNAIVQPRVK